MFKRALELPRGLSESFFLWGPRQVGKSTLLGQAYPDAFWIDLLKADELRRYVTRPEVLRTEVLSKKQFRMVVIDEVQKAPELLDEVHWLIENQKISFALCGSSARKVKRGHANLLGGRALRFELSGLVSTELGSAFDLVRILNHGYLPRHYEMDQPRGALDSYVSDYLKEEIISEGLVRNLPAFSNFLNVAALSDSELVNFSTIGRECGVSNNSIKGYFEILTDTLIGKWLPAYRRRPKRRTIGAPKFYFFDVGLVNVLAKRGRIAPGSELFGKAFENWVFHELSTCNIYRNIRGEFSHWRLSTGTEVDFIFNDMEVAVEAKAASTVTSDHLKGLRNLKLDYSNVKRRIVVCLDRKEQVTDDGIEILPYSIFAKRLWEGDILGSE